MLEEKKESKTAMKMLNKGWNDKALKDFEGKKKPSAKC